MEKSSLSEQEFGFITKLISIDSTGSSPEKNDTYGDLPYGLKPFSALKFFLDTAAKDGMRTGTIDNRVGWCEIGPEGANLIGIVCHLDVVPSGDGWETPPFKLTLKDGILYGRGIVDDKGPAAASYIAMKRLLDSGCKLSKRVRLILGTDEERTCSCVETYAAKGEIPSFSITPDAEFPVIYAEKGIMNIKISDDAPSKISATAGSAANMVPAKSTCTINGKEYKAMGKTAHASKPELGVNAIFEMIKMLNSDSADYSDSPILSFIANELVDKTSAEYTGCDITDESGSVTANPSILKCGEDGESLIIDIRCQLPDGFDHVLYRHEGCKLRSFRGSHDPDGASLQGKRSPRDITSYRHLERKHAVIQRLQTRISGPLYRAYRDRRRHLCKTYAQHYRIRHPDALAGRSVPPG